MKLLLLLAAACAMAAVNAKENGIEEADKLDREALTQETEGGPNYKLSEVTQPEEAILSHEVNEKSEDYTNAEEEALQREKRNSFLSCFGFKRGDYDCEVEHGRWTCTGDWRHKKKDQEQNAEEVLKPAQPILEEIGDAQPVLREIEDDVDEENDETVDEEVDVLKEDAKPAPLRYYSRRRFCYNFKRGHYKCKEHHYYDEWTCYGDFSKK